MRFCVRWMGNCRDIGDQQELEPPPDVPPNEVRDKKRLRRPKIRPQRWPTKIKRRPEIKGDVCVEMKFAPPTFFLSSVPFRETTPILQNRKKKPTFPGKLSTKDWKTRLLFSNRMSRRWLDWLRVSSALLWSSAINLITRLQSCWNSNFNMNNQLHANAGCARNCSIALLYVHPIFRLQQCQKTNRYSGDIFQKVFGCHVEKVWNSAVQRFFEHGHNTTNES